ncbi:MAG: hypothetical protein ACRDF4_11475, partial [Rhabdochlamydiaceae bacterium]
MACFCLDKWYQHIQAGEIVCHEWEKQAESLQQHLPEALQRASKQVFSADGVMVPLLGGIWAEVKTMAIGTVPPTVVGEPHV